VLSSSGVRAMVVGLGCKELKSLRYLPVVWYDEEPPESWMWFLEPAEEFYDTIVSDVLECNPKIGLRKCVGNAPCEARGGRREWPRVRGRVG